MDLKTRIKKRRIKLDLTQTQLAELAFMSQQTIQSIESGVVKNPRKINELACALQTTPEYLRFGVGDIDNASIGPSFKKSIPLISYVQAGAWADIHDVRDIEDLYNKNLVCPVNCSDSSFALRVTGVSMEPKFTDGDLIFVDPEASAENGSYVVARLEDENQATFKQLIIEGSQRFLKPLNKDWPDQLIPINGNCTIVGKVVFAGKEF